MGEVKQAWHFIDHCCRKCLGRLLQTETPQGVLTICAECAEEAFGGHEQLCCCGVEVGQAGNVLECYRNENRTPHSPQVVLVRERSVCETSKIKVRPFRPVRVPGYD